MGHLKNFAQKFGLFILFYFITVLIAYIAWDRKPIDLQNPWPGVEDYETKVSFLRVMVPASFVISFFGKNSTLQKLSYLILSAVLAGVYAGIVVRHYAIVLTSYDIAQQSGEPVKGYIIHDLGDAIMLLSYLGFVLGVLPLFILKKPLLGKAAVGG